MKRSRFTEEQILEILPASPRAGVRDMIESNSVSMHPPDADFFTSWTPQVRVEWNISDRKAITQCKRKKTHGLKRLVASR